eukprot:CAMPEP_0202476504 /NCGR_PEP_ID=MMETSP1360-20130828/93459_1 /ASSEMBLY_ACC=CAM_ASM_000848 /TAXON_ID=515479 /ORGANISM="Licmophora paradoxa, Strain CCMP2313" /LENGTH=364 /DNA_ID=CAMNT_0049103715 /DNA_START=408 /DNA_END=1503 /DNA_ORIENTATION=-
MPEILRVNLAQVVLQLKGMGVHDPRTFDFLTPPSSQNLMTAFGLLLALQAIDDKTMELTNTGKRLAKLPLDPTFGHLLLQSQKYGCTSDMLTSVAMMSSAETIFYRPPNHAGGGGEAGQRAAAAHRRFASYEGDIPTLLNIYNAWRKEVNYSANNNNHARRKYHTKQKQGGAHGQKLLSHGEWCSRNYINGRALARAYDVRKQLSEICQTPLERGGLGMDVSNNYDSKDRIAFFKAIAAGLCLQVSTRIVQQGNAGEETKKGRGNNNNNKGKNGSGGGGSGSLLFSSRGRYKTKPIVFMGGSNGGGGGQEVSIHPTSVMFGRNPAPKCVVYTEMLMTKKNYIRGVTQIREEWLPEVAPHLFQDG